MAAVGIFDSGVGGLSVLAELRQLVPEHPVVYVADQAWSPYGERSLDEVRQRSVMIARYLIARDCDLIVVACNSASAAALHHLRGVFPGTRFVGMEPAVKPAAHRSERGVIGVLATEATFQGELYASVVDRHANGTQIVEQACPGLADAVERLGVSAPETLELVDRYVTPMCEAGVDTLVLGCTHYPFLLSAIKKVAGSAISVIDPAPAVARQAQRLLEKEEVGGTTTFLTTGSAALFAGQIDALLGQDADPGHIKIDRRTAVVGRSRVTVAVGDLTTQDVDAIVNAANTSLQHGGGVAAAIAVAGGKTIQDESDEWVDRHGPLVPGQAAVTTAGAMPADSVIHVAGPIYQDGQDNEALLRAAVGAALGAGETIGAESIAFPAISAGIYGYPAAQATAVIADEAVRWLSQNPELRCEIRLIGSSAEIAEQFTDGLVAALEIAEN